MGERYWNGKVALVSGASTGLGLALAEELASRGAAVAMGARDAQRLEAAAQQVRRHGQRVLVIAADVTRPAEAAHLVERTRTELGRLDVLVNNVGRSARGRLAETSDQQFQELFELNLMTAVRMTRCALPELIARRGHVVNIGSLAAKAAGRWLGAYSATKFALAGYTQQLRLELEPDGVHVLLVCPGPIARDAADGRYDQALEGLPESARRPGGGVKTRQLAPADLARDIVRACERRQPELIKPAKARLLFVINQLSPRWGEWLIRRNT